MKSKITTFILFFVMIILIVGVGAIGYIMYDDLFNSESSEILSKINNIINENENEEEKTNKTTNDNISQSIQNIIDENISSGQVYYTNETNSQFFYKQLNDTQKIIYDGLKQNKQNLKQGDYVIEFEEDFSDILSKDNGKEELGKYYQTAIEAFMHDNPDLFYIDVNKMYVNMKTTIRFFTTTYEVYISAKEGQTYLSNDFANQNQVETAILAVENSKNRILEKTNGTDYQKISYIHDYLVDNIDYDSDYLSPGTYTIYGALVGKKCVCEGYAKAFKYLLNEAGIECELMQGIGINSSGGKESHAWNCVKLKNNWYEVDPTWDDPVVYEITGNRITGRMSDDMRYKYFLKSSSTFEKDHILSYQFSDGGKIFAYPTISSTDY